MDIKRIAFVRKGIEQQQYVKRYKISKNEKFVACALTLFSTGRGELNPFTI